MPIQINILEQYLRSHPNQPLVQSVIAGFREGFWPWAETASFPGDHLDYNQPRDLPEHSIPI
jgi:hypothetical protein